MIAGQLHANTVRVAGTDLSRVATAAALALEAGLNVWLSPVPIDLAADDTVAYLAEAARMAEELRSAPPVGRHGGGLRAEPVLRRLLPGATLDDRMEALTGTAPVPGLHASFGGLPRKLNAALGASAAAIRDHFQGPVTYASAPWEAVDWAGAADAGGLGFTVT
jgi:hypothetical protein